MRSLCREGNLVELEEGEIPSDDEGDAPALSSWGLEQRCYAALNLALYHALSGGGAAAFLSCKAALHVAHGCAKVRLIEEQIRRIGETPSSLNIFKDAVGYDATSHTLTLSTSRSSAMSRDQIGFLYQAARHASVLKRCYQVTRGRTDLEDASLRMKSRCAADSTATHLG